MTTQQASAGHHSSIAKSIAARRNARLPRSRRGVMPFLTLRKLAECLLLELQCQQAERYGSEMRRKELRIRHWPITEIAERMLEN